MKMCFTSFVAACLMFFGFPAAAAVLYVDLNSPGPVSPYADLSTAAISIQDAVDAASNGDLILVNDGYYQDGYRTTKESPLPGTHTDTNRVVINKPVTVQSLNGPSAAYISGSGIYRCVYLTNGAALNGFTLVSGVVGWVVNGQLTVSANGGGVAGTSAVGCVVSNCVLSGSSATGNGGGAYQATLINCQLTGNSARNGGGAAFSTLQNCTVTYNYLTQPATGLGGGLYIGTANNSLFAGNYNTFQGGGVWGAAKLVNCTIINNYATFYGGISPNTSPIPIPSASTNCQATNCLLYFNNSSSTNDNYGPGAYGTLFFDHCCTLPMPHSGWGNLTNEPTFANYWGGDYHLADDSPVINAGNNIGLTSGSDFTTSTDLDGNPRLVGGTVDIGAYEYQTPTSVLSYAWAQQYGLPTDGSADFVDTDGDGMDNWQEFVAGTDPTDPASVLTLLAPAPSTSPRGVNVTWQSVAGKTYYLLRNGYLTATSEFSLIQSNLTGQAGTTTFTDTTATNGNSFFYRIGVQ